MRIYKNQIAIDKRFLKFFEQLEKANKKEIDYFKSLPFGYAMRAYSKMKNVPNYTERVRIKAREFIINYSVSEHLILRAKKERLI